MSVEDKKELKRVKEKFLHRCDAAICIFKTESVAAALWSSGPLGSQGAGPTVEF